MSAAYKVTEQALSELATLGRWTEGSRFSTDVDCVTSMRPGRLPVGPQTGKTAHVTLRSMLWLCLLLLVTGCSLRALWLLILTLGLRFRQIPLKRRPSPSKAGAEGTLGE